MSVTVNSLMLYAVGCHFLQLMSLLLEFFYFSKISIYLFWSDFHGHFWGYYENKCHAFYLKTNPVFVSRDCFHKRNDTRYFEINIFSTLNLLREYFCHSVILDIGLVAEKFEEK